MIVVMMDLSSVISPSTVVSHKGQASLVSKGNKATATARLTLMISATECAIASVQIAPNSTVRLAHGQLKAV